MPARSSTLTLVIAAGCVMLSAAAFAQAPPVEAPPGYAPGAAPPASAEQGEYSRDRGQREPGQREWGGRDGGRGYGGLRERRTSGIGACRADMQDLCGRVAGGRGGRLQCLVENRDRVSPECADMLAALEGREPRGGRRADRFDDRREERLGRRDERAEARPEGQHGDRRAFGGERGGAPRPGLACRADAQALCGTVERGPARRQCLLQHEAQLSQPCREALAFAASRRSEARPAPPTEPLPR